MENLLKVKRRYFWMDGHALCFDKCSNDFEEEDGWYHVTFHPYQHRKQRVQHSGVHNLSHKHTPVASSLQVTSDRSKKHHVPYMVSKQCQPPMTCQLDDSHDSARKVPLVLGRRKDTSRYKKGVIGPPGRESPFPGQLLENYIVIWSLKFGKQGILKESTILIYYPCQC